MTVNVETVVWGIDKLTTKELMFEIRCRNEMTMPLRTVSTEESLLILKLVVVVPM